MEDHYKTAYGKTRDILKNLTSEELVKLGKDIGLIQEVIQHPDLILDVAAECITDSPELGKFIPVK